MGKTASPKKEIVIVGGSYAGVLAAKTIFKKIDEKNIHVTLISPNAYIYFNVAAPRLVIRPSDTERTLFVLKIYSIGTQIPAPVLFKVKLFRLNWRKRSYL